MANIGIRREDKNRWERRAPLTPEHVRELIHEQGRTVAVQPSPIRVFSDQAYHEAGAELREDLSDSHILLGVKEVPPALLIREMPYFFFSHVIKGYAANMPLLRRVLEQRCTLIDYEPIIDRYGRRLIFFGRHAGYAGMIDALWALGQRMLAEGVETAFAAVQPAHRYGSFHDAAEFLSSKVGQRIREQRLSAELHPLVIGLTGGGNVAQGAQEILGLLPVVEIHPEELPALARQPELSRRALYKVVFRRNQRTDFARYLPYLTVLVNGIYWEPGHPRLITRGDLRRLWHHEAKPRLRVIADLACDLEGSIEVTVRTTSPDDPVYVFDPESGSTRSGVTGSGPVILAVDNLPAELPRDASERFGDSLFPFLASLIEADYRVPFEHLLLPAAFHGAVIAHAGELAPRYRYLDRCLKQAGV